MRITFVLPDLNLGGGNLVVAIYANGLAARGHQVTVVARPYSRPTLTESIKSIVRNRGLPRKPGTITDQFFNVDVRLATAAEIARGAVLPDADILIATWWETMEWIASAGTEKGMKFHFIQDIETFDYLPQLRVHNALRHYSPKIVVSQWIADEMKSNFVAEDVHLIENAVDTHRFDTPVRNKNAQTTIGFVFTTTPRKNTKLAIEALTQIKQQMVDVKVIAFGSPNIQLAEWIEYHRNPSQEAIPKLYARCDIWLSPSMSEGFGLPILEAMASRTPVIATPAGAAPQLVSDENGQLVDLSVDSVVSAIKRISYMTNREWRTLSDNAHQQASKNTWPDAINKMENVLQSYAEHLP